MLAGSGFRHRPMGEDGLDHLVANRVDRIERSHRFLKDHGDVVAANIFQRAGIEETEINDLIRLAPQLQSAGSLPDGVGKQAHQGKRRQ
ncbi:hypothetical protein D3C80_1976190 [compost metagenome]